MADFDVAPAAGLQVVSWVDPEGLAGEPSRLLAHPANPLKRYKAIVRQPVRLEAVVAGVHAPLDAALGGRLFSCDLVEGSAQPDWIPPPVGQSSVIRFVPQWCGHYTIAVRRAGGGAILVPMDVEPA